MTKQQRLTAQTIVLAINAAPRNSDAFKAGCAAFYKVSDRIGAFYSDYQYSRATRCPYDGEKNRVRWLAGFTAARRESANNAESN